MDGIEAELDREELIALVVDLRRVPLTGIEKLGATGSASVFARRCFHGNKSITLAGGQPHTSAGTDAPSTVSLI